MAREIITREEVTNKELLTIIDEVTKKINQFFSIIHFTVNSQCSYFDSSTQNMQVKICKKDYHDFADDGNTQVPGSEYEVYWLMPLLMTPKDKDAEKRDLNLYSIEEGYEEKCIFFKMDMNERTSDERLRNRFITLYYSRPNDATHHTDSTSKGYHVCGSNIIKIDHENDNYELASVVSAKNAAVCIDLIEADLNRLKRIGMFRNYAAFNASCEPIK